MEATFRLSFWDFFKYSERVGPGGAAWLDCCPLLVGEDGSPASAPAGPPGASSREEEMIPVNGGGGVGNSGINGVSQGCGYIGI